MAELRFYRRRKLTLDQFISQSEYGSECPECHAGEPHMCRLWIPRQPEAIPLTFADLLEGRDD